MNQRVRIVLVAGMAVSMTLLIAGLAWYAISPSNTNVTLGPTEALKAAMAGDPIGLIDLGILALIATPLLRVLTALFVFATGREYKFVLVSLLVLAVIAVAILVKG